MSDPTESLGEQERTYVIQDHSHQEELLRLHLQDKMLNTGMGGVLPEQTNHSRLRRVLDVGCGTGNWLMEAATAYPTLEKLVGIDINDKTLTFARTQAREQSLDKKVEFRTMDALHTLDFPDHSFDLVNQRCGTSWLRTWDWEKILPEYQRVTQPGGVIRITEYNIIECNSPALTTLCDISLKAYHRAGYFFTPSRDGLTHKLPYLMTQHNIENVQTQPHPMLYRTGTPAHQDFYKDMRGAFRSLVPFLQKWTSVPSNYDEIYEQAMQEIQHPDFSGTMTFTTFWGTTKTNQ